MHCVEQQIMFHCPKWQCDKQATCFLDHQSQMNLTYNLIQSLPNLSFTGLSWGKYEKKSWIYSEGFCHDRALESEMMPHLGSTVQSIPFLSTMTKVIPRRNKPLSLHRRMSWSQSKSPYICHRGLLQQNHP